MNSFAAGHDEHSPQLVSIIVCVFNGEHGIADVLESLRIQTYASIEVVVVDDGSTDGTYPIAESFTARDNRFHVVRHAHNQRLAASRNTGVIHSHGDIICFTDDDCSAERHWVAALVTAYQANPSLDGIGGKILPLSMTSLIEHYASDAKNPVYGHTATVEFGGRFWHYVQKFFSWKLLAFHDGDSLESIMGMNASYRRRVFDALASDGLYFDTTLRRGVDWEFNVRLQERFHPRFAYCDAAIMYHRHRGTWTDFLRHIAAYGTAYVDVASRHARIKLLPYPVPFLLLTSFALAWFHWAFLLIPAFLYAKDIPFIVFSVHTRRDWRFLVYPFLDWIRETAYTVGLIRGVARHHEKK